MSRKTDPEHKRFSVQASGMTVTITETKIDISEKSILNLGRVWAESESAGKHSDNTPTR